MEVSEHSGVASGAVIQLGLAIAEIEPAEFTIRHDRKGREDLLEKRIYGDDLSSPETLNPQIIAHGCSLGSRAGRSSLNTRNVPTEHGNPEAGCSIRSRVIGVELLNSHAMKNIQAIDGAENATFSIFQATDEEFELLFPDGTDVAFAEDIEARLTEEQLHKLFDAVWSRPVEKKTVQGIHGTYFVDLDRRKVFFPSRKEAEVLNRGPEAVEALDRMSSIR